MAHSQQVFKLGATPILTHSDAFDDGYANGFVAYPQTAPQPLTDTMLYDLIMSNMLDVHASHEWNTGFVVGALEGLRKGNAEVPTPNGAVVQCDPVTLRLDNWRFREGFLLGQEDRQANLAEQETGHVLSVHELLSSITYRDPDTRRYCLTDEALNALEETLGQLVGYLWTTCCSGSSANQQAELVSTHLPVTEPLLHLVFQES